MARKRYKPEEIVAKLRQVDVLVSQGQNMVDAIRQIGVMRDFETAISQRVQKIKLCAAWVAVPKFLRRGIGSSGREALSCRLLREANER